MESTTLTVPRRLSDLSQAKVVDTETSMTEAQSYREELTKVLAQLDTLRTDLTSTQLLQEQVVEVREAKAILEAQSSVQNQQIILMEEQLAALRTERDSLVDKAQQLEATLADRPVIEEGLIERLNTELLQARQHLKLADETESNIRSELQLVNEKVQGREEDVRILLEEKIQIEAEVCCCHSSVSTPRKS